MRNVTYIELSWHTLWKVCIFSAIIAVLYLSKDAIGVLFASVVISLGLDPIVSFLESKKVPRIIGTLILFITVFLAVAIGVYFIIPIIAVETSSFLEHFHEFMSSTFGFGFPDNIVDALTFSKDKIFSYFSLAGMSVAETISKFSITMAFVAATIIMTFYLSVEKDGTERLLKVVLPESYESPVLKVFGRFKTKIRRWMAAQASLSAVVGLLVWLGLWAIGVRYAFVIGMLAAVLEIVPVIGPVMVGVVAFLVAVSDSMMLGVYSVAFFFGVQQLENHILLPLIMGKGMKVNPVVVLMALLAGGKIAGFVGILLAVPIAVIIQEIFGYIAEKKNERTRPN